MTSDTDAGRSRFSIRFVDASDDPETLGTPVGRLEVNGHWELLLSPTSPWSAADYEEHWRASLGAIVSGSESKALLVTSLETNGVEWMLQAYTVHVRPPGFVGVRERLWLPEWLPRGFAGPDDFSQLVRSLDAPAEPGETPPWELMVDIGALADFLNEDAPREYAIGHTRLVIGRPGAPTTSETSRKTCALAQPGRTNATQLHRTISVELMRPLGPRIDYAMVAMSARAAQPGTDPALTISATGGGGLACSLHPSFGGTGDPASPVPTSRACAGALRRRSGWRTRHWAATSRSGRGRTRRPVPAWWRSRRRRGSRRHSSPSTSQSRPELLEPLLRAIPRYDD